MKSPAFQFYPSDWISDAKIAMATLEEEGAYIRLLCFAWREGWIPACPQKCAVLIGKGATEMLARVVQGWFKQHPTDASKLVHERMERDREKQASWRAKSSEGGKKSAEKRAANRVKMVATKSPEMVEDWLEPKPNSSSSTSVVVGSASGETEKASSATPKNTLTIPDNLRDVQGFRAAWAAFAESRKKLRKPMTHRAAEIILARLSERPEMAVRALEISVEKGWQSFDWSYDCFSQTPNRLNGFKSDIHSPDHNPL